MNKEQLNFFNLSEEVHQQQFFLTEKRVSAVYCLVMSKFRSIYPALFSCSLFFILLSCSTDTDTVSVSIKTAPVASYAVSSDTITVSSEDISGKTLYLAVINPSDQIISADDVPYAVSSSGLAGKSALIRSPVSVHSGICPVSDSAAVQPETDDVWNAVRISRVQASSRSAESSAGSETVLGTGTQKSFYLKSGSVKTATLRDRKSTRLNSSHQI